jgi:hypothetical protein
VIEIQPLPWTKMRQAYALVSLCESMAMAVESMRQSALAFDVVNVSRVAAAKEPRPSAGNSKVVQLPLSRFARPSEQLETKRPVGDVDVTTTKERV